MQKLYLLQDNKITIEMILYLHKTTIIMFLKIRKINNNSKRFSKIIYQNHPLYHNLKVNNNKAIL